jgi:DNA (cytosine-5)-methyltransferase 1
MMLDLFAGAGGVSLGARMVGIEELGVEIDRDACATRDAAGFATIQGDIAAMDPLMIGKGTRTLWASPPCPSFSSAGKRLGMTTDLGVIYAAMDRLDRGEMPDWAALAGQCADARSALVLQPHRWILALDDTLEIVAFEQVPPVLSIWERTARWLRGFARPYHVWTGILQAADFGVPQTRERAFLMASRLGPIQPPAVTHSRYGGFWTKPWVSMAEALGWSGAVATDSGNGYAHDYERDTARPAPTVIERARLWRLRNGTQEKACERGLDEPAGTLFFGDRLNDVSWVVRTRGDRADGGGNEFKADDPSWALTEKTRSWLRSPQSINGGERDYRSESSPSVTVTSGFTRAAWTRERPATTVCARNNLNPPGLHKKYDNSMRITIEEASVLQGFPWDFPWKGSRTACFRQAGNAVPPIVAARVIATLHDIEVPKIGEAA